MKFELKDASLLKTKCYVNGEWVGAASGLEFDIENPSTAKIVAQCPDFDEADTTLAIKAAAAAFPTFKKTSARSRARLLRKWYDLMIENHEDLAQLITLENGKTLADSRIEVTYAANFLEWFSEEAPRIYGDTMEASNPSARMITTREPIGVCGLIAPWNFPAAMITRKAGPALAAGCTLVIKTPGEAPLTALALSELAHRAGFPAGVINFVTTLKHTPAVGKILCTHPTIKKVSFTGSTPVGKLLMGQSASTLKKLSFELGGNAPFIVFEDADLDKAVAALVGCKFRVSGQTCVCANRIFVHKDVHDVFVRKLANAIEPFVVGDGFNPASTHGPVIHGRAIAKVREHIEDAVRQGATIAAGGKALPELGPYFHQPTILTGMKAGMKVCSEETFGPLASIFQFETEDEVLALANEVDVGLAGYFFSRDASRCWRVAEALEVGMVGVNSGSVSDVAGPFGGVKESGFGREGSKYGIDEYLTTKMMMIGI
ncbi:succinate semialdehyde dehydrogenase NADP+ linked [Ceratocystis pirilliformis]|uniref:Succinate-semialdehyde dehydrogenase n=1 Tax=Ceratocystis pirilliformis TaxID=259994 RepID=A0ABR3YTB7_9PEZI